MWEEKAKGARGTSRPDFARYFTTYVAEEMKEKMLLPIRREAGLGDGFFYDNAVESMNKISKTKIREQNTSTSVTGAKSLNCTWLEAVKVHGNMLEETRRNICRAVIDMGPYKLAQDFQHLKVEPHVWAKKFNATQKLKAVRKLDTLATTEDLATAHSEVVGVEKRCSIAHSGALEFEDSGLSEMMKASWENARRLS